MSWEREWYSLGTHFLLHFWHFTWVHDIYSTLSSSSISFFSNDDDMQSACAVIIISLMSFILFLFSFLFLPLTVCVFGASFCHQEIILICFSCFFLFSSSTTVSLLRGLKHNNIVTLHDIIHTDKSLTLVFEYLVSCVQGDTLIQQQLQMMSSELSRYLSN